MSTQERDFLRSDFDALINNLGPNLSYMTASVHYRGSWAQWLTEPHMQLAFMVDRGQGSLGEIRTWFKQYVTTKGYPNIELIPHANSFGEIETKKDVPIEPWQLGLMSTQYLIEAIQAGYDFTFGFPGFLGDYDGSANLDKTPDAIAGMKNSTYTKAPMLYALSSIGEALQHDAALIPVTTSDTGLVTLGLLNSHHLRLYLINKHNTAVTTAISTDVTMTTSSISVQRFSEKENLLKIIPKTILSTDPGSPTKLYATLTPYSMTVLDISI
jgi:hypothetical protein